MLIDFDDSFTYNLVQELEEIGIETTVVHWLDFESLPQEGMLVLGPGPGHPDDYQRIFPLVSEWLKMEKYFFGVCLGHQILWRITGEEITRSKEPQHGQKLKLELTGDWQEWLDISKEVWVQRYNSLAVLAQGALRNPQFHNFIQNEEILITRGKNCLTYQFHPESLGTTFRQAFFLPLIRKSV